ncbi:MAG: hypothetical protein IJT59_07280 [Desulfovibrionaceae bacterium]|nr:hypothetical protein [Desulfovibrionaceae bacterium]
MKLITNINRARILVIYNMVIQFVYLILFNFQNALPISCNILVKAFLCYQFCQRKYWAAICLTIILILEIFSSCYAVSAMLPLIHITSILIFIALAAIDMIMIVATIYYLYAKESRNWFRNKIDVEKTNSD